MVHGIPNTPVDVFVNGKSTLSDFKPGTVAGPLTLPACTDTVAIGPADLTVKAGTETIVAAALIGAIGVRRSQAE